MLTCDLCVKTILNTKDIIDIYPCKLSNDFNKENWFTSDNLTRKRKVGNINGKN